MKSGKLLINILFVILFLFTGNQILRAQKKGLGSVTTSDLESHLKFLASDELQGRETGEPGLEIAARYLASQAQKIGLKAADENLDYFQKYIIEENSYDLDNSIITIESSVSEPITMDDDFYLIIPEASEDLNITGDVVFCGYGINSEKFRYNDFKEVDVQDKIVLIMDRSPMDESGTDPKFDDYDWNNMMNFNFKFPYINSLKPKAVLLVFDPKSGYRCLADINPAFPKYFTSSKNLKGNDDPYMAFLNGAAKVFIIHSNLADKLLDGTGMDLETLQEKIDESLEPHSFPVQEKILNIHLDVHNNELNVSNVFGIMEGSDPVLKNEYVLYIAHYDHVGVDGMGGIYNGADDNTSGCAALLEMAEAFIAENNKPKRSIGFLWVSAEEIGLFGSQYYSENPIIPLEKTVAAINLDMVGRSRTSEDVGTVMGDEISVLGGDSIGVIGGLQSKVLMTINQKTLKQMNMTGDYRYNDPHHPERLFYRSDHINFANKDIPILFYSTGIHKDYHQLTDTPDRIDYEKLKKVTGFTFMIGYNTANYNGEIVIDYPFSEWGEE